MYILYKLKIKKILSLPRLSAFVALVLLVLVSLSSPLEAQTAFTQGYGTDEMLQRGMIVRLKKDDSSKVAALTSAEIEDMHGVVVDANDAPVTLSAEGQKAFVATGGRYDVLVSSQNGEIKAGDYITISALNGVGMRAGAKESKVVGRALADFNGKDAVVGTTEVKDSDGKARQVAIGRVSTDISVSRNPNFGSDEPALPQFVRRAAESIAGKKVDANRVYLAMAIFVVSTIVAATLMYGGVRSGIISIGRNPLSKKSIIRGMIQVVLFGLIVFILGLFGVYLLLKL
ncbi:hypothetical protein H0X10_02980 [Candidatus Saccharibacteria bacterium]|nr:hypothetical protein [Candidatus Saccharibacteria bacterium]